VTFLIIAPYKYSYLLTYLLTYIAAAKAGNVFVWLPVFVMMFVTTFACWQHCGETVITIATKLSEQTVIALGLCTRNNSVRPENQETALSVGNQVYST